MKPLKQFLPEPYYWTIPWLAERWGTHPDRVLAMIESGAMTPAATLPKSALPVELPGLALHVVVMLRDHDLRWEGSGAERVAQLVGTFRAHLPDLNRNIDLVLRLEDAVFIQRADLVVLDDERERIEGLADLRPLRSDERRTLQLTIAVLAEMALPKFGNQPYALAERISVVLDLAGVALGRQAVANKIKESLTLLPSAAAEKVA